MRREIQSSMRNGLLFREVNERILEMKAFADESETVEVLCECGDEACITTVVMTIRDYAAVRAEYSRFISCDGHERLDIERVVLRTPGYLVVERIGEE
jgi:hypothetical protein